MLDVTVKDGDKEHEEEKLIPDYDEEGNYIRHKMQGNDEEEKLIPDYDEEGNYIRHKMQGNDDTNFSILLIGA